MNTSAVKTALVFVTVGGLIACAPKDTGNVYGAAVDNTPAYDQADADLGERADPAVIEANIGRLLALEVFQVGQLVLDVPEGAFNCYGPCPEFADEIDAAQLAQGLRLAAFVDAAEASALQEPADYSCADGVVAANLDILRNLEIVEVGSLIEAVPENNPACYNLPCGEDVAAAEVITCERAGVLANLVDSLDESGSI